MPTTLRTRRYHGDLGLQGSTPVPWKLNRGARPTIDLVAGDDPTLTAVHRKLLRKEVIQPQVLLQLPCYDFTPIADHTMDSCLPLRG